MGIIMGTKWTQRVSEQGNEPKKNICPIVTGGDIGWTRMLGMMEAR